MSRFPELCLYLHSPSRCTAAGPKEVQLKDSVLSDESATVEGTTSDSDADSGEGGATADVIKVADLSYTLPAGVDARLATIDLFRFDDDIARPLVVLVHGGSWVGGDKSNFELAAPAFVPWWTDRGYTVAAVNFRLATPYGSPLEVGPKDQANDIAHAVSWLMAEGAALGIASEPAVLVGFSSGAHLVALLGADASYLTAAGTSWMPSGPPSLRCARLRRPRARADGRRRRRRKHSPDRAPLGSTESERRSSSPVRSPTPPPRPRFSCRSGHVRAPAHTATLCTELPKARRRLRCRVRSRPSTTRTEPRLARRRFGGPRRPEHGRGGAFLLSCPDATI